MILNKGLTNLYTMPIWLGDDRPPTLDPRPKRRLDRGMDSPEQKFFVSDDGKEKLSITKAELQAGIDSGKYGEKTLAWTKGMSGWLPLSDPSWEKHGILMRA